MIPFRIGLKVSCSITLSLCLLSAASAGELRWPLDRPQRITGTFCEPRGFRFHMGLDVSCGGLKGFAVRAADEGYVSTVMYQKWGIGYAVFITHPDGTRSFYGHMDGFAPSVLSVPPVKKHRNDILDRRDFQADLDKNDLPVKRGTLIGYSGDSGIGREHFHFELRDAGNVNLNPLAHGITVPDNRPPVFTSLYLHPMDPRSHVNGSNDDFYVRIIPVKGRPGQYVLRGAVQPVVGGKIGVKVKIHDYINYTRRVAVYHIAMFQGDKKQYEIFFDRMSKNDANRMGLYYDLDRTGSSSYTHNLFLRDSGVGIIDTGVPGKKLAMTVTATDARGNVSLLKFILLTGHPLSTPAYVYKPNLRPGRSLRMKSSDRRCSVLFEGSAAYYDEMVSLSVVPSIQIAVPGLTVKSRLYLSSPTDLCLRTPAEVSLDYRGDDSGKVGMYLLDPKTNFFYNISNTYNRYRGRFTASTHRMGGFFLIRDDAPPKIRFRGKKKVKQGHRFRFYVSDVGSGINLARVRLTVDGNPVHWDYDPDYSYIEILPHSDIWQKGNHSIHLQIEDCAGNTSSPLNHGYSL